MSPSDDPAAARAPSTAAPVGDDGPGGGAPTREPPVGTAAPAAGATPPPRGAEGPAGSAAIVEGSSQWIVAPAQDERRAGPVPSRR